MPKDVNEGKRRWAIYRARKKKGFTLKDVSELAFLSDATIEMYEIGKLTPATARSWESFDAICKALNLTREEALPITDEKLCEQDG